MAAKYKPGDLAYIIESNRFIREVQVRSAAGGMYVIRFTDTGGGIKVKESRLFPSKEDAERSLQKKPEEKRKKTPYDYM